MPVTEPSRSWMARLCQAPAPLLSLSKRVSIFGKSTGFELMNFAPLMVFSVVTPELVNISQERAPARRLALSW